MGALVWLVGSRAGRIGLAVAAAVAVAAWLRIDAVRDERAAREAEAARARLESIEQKREIEHDVRQMDRDRLRDCAAGLRC